jgi:hypothetical protein
VSLVEAGTDGGHSFARRAILTNGDSTNAYNESSVAQFPSGKLVALIRHQVSGRVGHAGRGDLPDNGFTRP